MDKIKTVIAPKGCAKYLTEGKEYEVTHIYGAKRNSLIFVVDDDGDELICCLFRSAYLKGGDWIIGKVENIA